MIAAAALLLAAPAASAIAPAEKSALFAREAMRICVDTEAAGLRPLAQAERWTVISPSLVRSHTRTTTSTGEVRPAAAWQVQKAGLAFTVSLVEMPGGLLFRSRCEIGAWDLDLGAAHATFTADPRLKDRSQPGWPIKQYEMEKPRLSIVYEAGELDGRVLHTFAAER